MGYCKVGDKPIVTYKFADTQQRRYESSVAPIEVVLKPYDPQFNGGQCYVNYQVDAYRVYSLGHQETQNMLSVRVYYSGIARGRIIEIPTEYPSTPFGGFSINATQFAIISRSQAGLDSMVFLPLIRREPDGFINSGNYTWNYHVEGGITSVRRVDEQPDNCGDPKRHVQLIVSYQNQKIFSDFGEAPGKFEVACEGCPPGTVKCPSPGYPGYCCLPCNPTISEIKSITNLVKSLK